MTRPLAREQTACLDNSVETQQKVVELIPALRAFARTFSKSQDEADDLVQETLFRAIRAIDQFQPGTSLKSWLFTIMRNTFCNLYNTRQRERPGTTDCASLAIPIPPTQEWSALGNDFRSALESLSPHHREVLIMVGALGFSYEEAAEVIGCPVGTIKSRLCRAREDLERAMQGNPLQ